MLHICRKYKPDCVMLYLSKEMVERHRRDDRYCDSLRRLAAQEGFSPEILVEERPKLSEVQVYDFFFQEFRPLLLSLHSRFPEHRLILNIASGTPAMKSALYLLAAFLPFPVLPVQTATPVKAQNPRLEPRMEYDVDLYWECNLDNEDYIDRCREGQYENLNLQLQKRNISAHLRAYDYAAALAVAEPIRALLNPGAVALLEAARARVELNWRSIKPEVKGELGLLGSSQRRIELAEYLLWLQMKQRRGDLADFLRGSGWPQRRRRGIRCPPIVTAGGAFAAAGWQRMRGDRKCWHCWSRRGGAWMGHSSYPAITPRSLRKSVPRMPGQRRFSSCGK